MSSNHEPAGTRSYDNNPRSPYYDELEDTAEYLEAKEQALENMAEKRSQEREEAKWRDWNDV